MAEEEEGILNLLVKHFLIIKKTTLVTSANLFIWDTYINYQHSVLFSYVLCIKTLKAWLWSLCSTDKRGGYK